LVKKNIYIYIYLYYISFFTFKKIKKKRNIEKRELLVKIENLKEYVLEDAYTNWKRIVEIVDKRINE